MKYNEKYDLYVTTGGLVYSYDSKQDKLILCEIKDNGRGYKQVRGSSRVYVHRLVWETFNGDIPDGFEIDHEDTHKDNNALSNLKLCTHKENCNNPKSRQNKSKSLIGNTNTKGKTFSEFGAKFKEHFGIAKYENAKLYNREWAYWKRNKICSWEL